MNFFFKNWNNLKFFLSEFVKKAKKATKKLNKLKSYNNGSPEIAFSYC